MLYFVSMAAWARNSHFYKIQFAHSSVALYSFCTYELLFVVILGSVSVTTAAVTVFFVEILLGDLRILLLHLLKLLKFIFFNTLEEIAEIFLPLF